MNLKKITRGFSQWIFIAALLAATGCSPKKSAGPGGAPPTSVVVIEAKSQGVVDNLSLVGTVTANEMVELKSEIDGTILEIDYEEGKKVRKGDLLVRLDDTKLAAAVAETEANFKLSQSTFERAKQLLNDKLISQQEFDQTASAFQSHQATLDFRRRELKDARILAPFSGTVGARTISPGQVISRATTLTWLVDFDPVKVEINVPERFISQLQIGQIIEINVATYPGKKFKGDVYFIAPYVDPTTRTALVKARISNPKGELKPGMFANLDLTLKTRENSLVIPEAALVQLLEGDKALVFVVDKDSKIEAKTVKLGLRLAGFAEVLSGLQNGERVVIEGIQKVGPGAMVTPQSEKEKKKD